MKLEETLFCVILGIFFMIVLMKWPCFERFQLQFLNNETECEQCCNSLSNNYPCGNVCIFGGYFCPCCSK